MSIVDLILLLLVAGIIGALGQAVGGYSSSGCAMSIVIGFVGAIIGRWAKHAFGLPELYVIKVGHANFPLIWSVLGAAAFVLILRLILGRRLPRD